MNLFSSQNLFRKKSIEDINPEELENVSGLKRSLRLTDLTSMGIAAIVGAGIFSTIGNAASQGGPAVVFLFIFTSFACALSAFCYARFASLIPVSGSAYTYTYTSLGELAAWVIGWVLIMEYAVGNIAVAISWSDYFTGLMNDIGLKIPAYFSTDYLSALSNFKSATTSLQEGIALQALKTPQLEGYLAWTQSPKIMGLRIIADLPAFSIVVLITWLVYVGINETRKAGNMMVALKLLILVFVIVVGAFYVDTDNWNPFAPNGIGGVLKGVSGVFFAYIGFDAISTTAEECKNPQRDLPRGMMLSLAITTVLYVTIALIITGMVNYSDLGVGDPIAFVFSKLNLKWISGIIAVSAIVAMASVLLVFQVGQPRIWMSMSRDGLLPKPFSRIHKKYKTPYFATIITGIVVAIPSMFMNLTSVTDLTSIGTLFAFLLVCLGVIVLDEREKKNPELFAGKKAKFKIPYYNSRYFLPIIVFIFIVGIFQLTNLKISNIFHFDIHNPEVFSRKMKLFIFIAISIIFCTVSIIKSFSLIPVLGFEVNLYLMSELHIQNWKNFGIWMIIGLIIYFSFSYKNSKLNLKLNDRNSK